MSKKTDPVLDAVLHGDAAAIQEALRAGLDPNLPDQQGRTPLINAVIDDKVEIANLLIGGGCSVGMADKQGFTPLHYAAQRYSLVLTEILLSAGASVDARDSFGNTPLFRAVFESRGRSDVINALVEAGSDQHAKNNSGVSPRDLATSIRNFEVLSLLPPV